ncbi:M48 family metallopeptidase [Psittacicella gerlachiana]|uniref:Type I deoxyribonuclease HsdR n=1 Tax=Psittacicella gerlachiana TaxID=2028574 RepID=A0A3A1YGI1_9GAMM|nr:M48 family metallopeptidase [Psittacicella gerlachiana]RIY35324.1 type I deoxyribonuclease HsdR [Psittacicella gerlachiana]
MKLKKFFLVLCLGASLGGCASVAELAGYNTQKLNEIGAQSYQTIRQEEKSNIDTTSATAQRINAVYRRLIPFANQLNQTGVAFDWQLTVIRKDVLNAFVLPGGRIVFYTGLIEKLKLNDNEIAAVMGHEMIHALNEHSKQRIGQQVLVSGAIAVGAVATGTNNSLVTSGAGYLADLGLVKPFSRANETEADIEGLFLMARAGYNPESAITLWQKMEKYSGSSNFSLLSTHPSDEQRYKTLKENLPKAMELYQQARKS